MILPARAGMSVAGLNETIVIESCEDLDGAVYNLRVASLLICFLEPCTQIYRKFICAGGR